MWSGCSGSLIPNLFAPGTAAYDAAYGTVAHGIAEKWLRKEVKPRALIGTVENVVQETGVTYAIEIDHDMLDHVQRYVDWCRFLAGTHFVEERVDFSHLTPIPKQGGTADHAAVTWQRLVITDLKMGLGERVVAKENTQALLYAIGFFEANDWLYDFQDIILRIAQPRQDHFDEWSITRKELLEWADWLKERAHAAWRLDAPRTPSEKACRWCKVKQTCGAHAVFQAELFAGAFDDLTEAVTPTRIEALKERLDRGEFAAAIEPYELSSRHLGILLGYEKFATSWWASVKAEAEKRALTGDAIKGHKLVRGRSSRHWVNPQQAAPMLIALGCKPEDVYVEEVCSPAVAEELLRKAGHRRDLLPVLMKDLAVKTPGRLLLAAETDARSVESTDLGQGAFIDLTVNPETGEL